MKAYSRIRLVWSLKRFSGRQLMLFLFSKLKCSTNHDDENDDDDDDDNGDDDDDVLVLVS